MDSPQRRTLQLVRLLCTQGEWEQAVKLCRELVIVEPDCIDALHLLTAIALRGGDYEEAIITMRKMLHMSSQSALINFNIAVALRELGRFDEEVAAYDEALAQRGSFFEAWFNRGNAMRKLGRHHDAIVSFDRAIAIRPDCAEAFNNRGNVLGDLHRYVEALDNFGRALALSPTYAEAHNNRGNALEGLGYHDEALLSYEQAQRCAPDYADAYWNESLCRLLIGDYARGWERYEWRWRTGVYTQGYRPEFPAPLWLGRESLEGRTILLHAEGGLGDTLQFCRFAKFVSARGARVLLEVQPELLRLLANLDGVDEIFGKGEPRPHFDFHCPLMSLPHAFGTLNHTIPASLPYITADLKLVEDWSGRIGEKHKPLRVGLVWAGNPRLGIATSHAMDKRRSIPFPCLEVLLEVPDIDFYSLQKGEAAVAQLTASSLAHVVIDMTDEVKDFADTAALLAHLDLVIAVDTSTAHLAGAMGKPVWLLNRYDTCWRWFIGRSDSPWYPKVMRIFRQPVAGDWGTVMVEVADALRQLSVEMAETR
ncbi:tetratricopeptide repeat protein [Burkholderia metallica]|uniref:tetratricopeptide repeat-containing glycosyltransferase family protein n=1 Tax=Burkholderia metallica TaxID=488729 RepID=UPI001CF47401|nr:tetratricopeptide repeat-containing glycosyltransferase family protein [Burkholderia metallica]MCA8003456.1 tetratricopeptide repeat-containing glycosyltransferase family protein [Burkholderia metallica]